MTSAPPSLSLTTSLTNLTFPEGFVNLRNPKNEGFVISSAPGTGTNTEWEFVQVNTDKPGLFWVKNKAVEGDSVTVGVAEGDLKPAGPRSIYQAPVYAGGTCNEFVTWIKGNGVMICLPGEGDRPNLYWTLENDMFNTPIRLMELRKDDMIKTQIWSLNEGRIILPGTPVGSNGTSAGPAPST